MAIGTPPEAPPAPEAPPSAPTSLSTPAAPHRSWWQRLTIAQWMALAVGGGIVAVVILALLYSKSTASQATTSPKQSSPNTTTATPAPTSAPTPLDVYVGTNVPTTAGDSYQVIEYRGHVTSNNPYNVAPAGGYFAAANVKECASTANSASAPISASAFEWRLIMSDASQVTGSQADLLNLPGSPLNYTQLAQGQCISGWVSFAVPGGATPTQIQPINADFYWTLP